MSYKYLSLVVENNTLLITIDRPKVMNALNAELLQELGQIFQNEAIAEDVKGIIITGSGEKAFAAGADIAEIHALNLHQAKKMSNAGQDVFFAIENFSKPVIAAVNGFALGGGCELAMACHMRIASQNTKFGQPEVNLGLIPGYGGTQRLTKLIGKAKSMELTLTGDMIKADEAKTLGLANHVCELSELIDKCFEILGKIYTKSPLSISKAITAVNAAEQGGNDGFELEAELFAESVASQDGKEGTLAFMEKRKANFTGK